MQRVIHFLPQDEFKRLLAVIATKRDRAIFLLAYRHGLWASEIGLLQRPDVDLKQGRITVHRLKGALSTIYPMQPDMQKLLRSYLCTRTDDSPGSRPGPGTRRRASSSAVTASSKAS